MILVIAATLNKNLILAQKIEEILQNEFQQKTKLISLENFELPLYSPVNQSKNGIPQKATELFEVMNSSQKIIWVSPEYNGGVPPIVSNGISWVSVCGNKTWREAFNEKITLICGHSSGPATKYFNSFKFQLEHLGSVVLGRTIQTSDANPINVESAKKVLKLFLSLKNS
jgi:chromate reductase